MTKHSALRPYVAAPYSYAFGRSNKMLKYETIDQALRSTVKRQPDQLAIASVHENVEWTFYQLEERVEKLSQILAKKLLVTRGDVVAIMTANTCKFVVIQYACARIGAIFCPINAYYQSKELEYSLHKVNPKVFFIPGQGSQQGAKVNRFYDVFTAIADNLPQSLQHVVLLDGEASKTTDLLVKIFSYNSLMDAYCSDSDVDNKNEKNAKNTKFTHGKVPSTIGYFDADKPCNLFQTSGTTGPPKAAIISHYNLVNNARLTGERLGIGPGKNARVCCPVPIFHSFGCAVGVIAMSICGTALVFPGFRNDTESTVQAIISQKCTYLLSVSTMLMDMLDYIEKNGIEITTLRGILTTALAMPYELAKRVRKAIPGIGAMHIAYGSSETMTITLPLQGDYIENTLDNVGMPLDFTEVKIVDQHSGDVVEIGQTGEILTRGPCVFLGYWNDDIETRKAIDSSGWYRTGDLATMDSKGYVKIVGRAKEIIIRGGTNIYPREIEEILITNPYISEAAVYGLPQDRLGEDICAWIKLKDPSKNLTEKEVREFCKGKMAYFKIPKCIIFVTKFPKTASGKVQKFRMRELHREVLEIKSR
ncbi:medium-chain acyl-CoA ligase ACSF2, mitochondrial-like [Brevipalpus obovatus]|uniref:medium-chain acyl-CoA ligase ACSF2, mitochondrial-like n=1 Tax=Brevipalpus obovatus TaxID=246614 RepID=UPI003D9E75A4